MPPRTCFPGDTMFLIRSHLFFPLLLAIFSLHSSLGHDIGHQCDWSGSGLSPGTGRGVTPVYLRCRSGTVSWSYPRGALRVLLRLPSSREFRACLRPAPNFAPASLFLEAPRSLTKLYSPTDAHRRHVRCFDSRGGQAALYVEAAEPRGSAKREVAEFSYDLTPMPRGKHHEPGQECRPCTREEMTQAFCTSELVVRGIIQRVEPIEGTDVSEIKLRVSKTLKEAAWENEVDGLRQNENSATVEVGRECGARHGGGEVVVMARRRLGSLVLVCAPRLHEWAAVVKRANATESAHCLLYS